MLKRHHLHLSSLGLFFLVLGVGLWYSLPARPSEAQSGSACSAFSGSLSGYAWSSNIGWIGFEGWEGSDLSGARLNSDCSFSGFGWNPNIGWIDFNPVASDWPADPGNPADLHGVRVENVATGALSGWARACSPFAGHCVGALDTNTERGGWDGWISFSGTATDVGNTPYGVTFDSSTSKFAGHAWGGLVTGWVGFPSIAANGNPVVVTIDQLQVSCEATPNPAPLSSGSVSVAWEADAAGGQTPYTYSWSGDDGLTGAIATINHSYDSVGAKFANVQVTDSTVGTAKTGNASCSVEVVNPSTKVLTVIPTGTGAGNIKPEPVTGVIDCHYGEPGITDCEETYSGSPTIVLHATPNPSLPIGPNPDSSDDGSTFVGSLDWVGCDSVLGNGDCEVAVDSTKTVIAYFHDNIIGNDPDICVTDDPDDSVCPITPQIIKIGQQTDGVRTSSSRVYIKNNVTPAQKTIVVLKTLQDKDNQPLSVENLSALTCNMGDDNPRPCGDGVASYVLPAVSDASFPFSITVDDLSAPLLTKSPFTITFEILGVAGGTDEETVEFRYQPTGLEPR